MVSLLPVTKDWPAEVLDASLGVVIVEDDEASIPEISSTLMFRVPPSSLLPSCFEGTVEDLFPMPSLRRILDDDEVSESCSRGSHIRNRHLHNSRFAILWP